MFRPLRNQILVKPLDKRQSQVLHVVSGDKASLGEIVAVGPKAIDVKPGDRIHFGTTENYLTFPEYEENGERYLILSENDVCFVEELEISYRPRDPKGNENSADKVIEESAQRLAAAWESGNAA